MLIPDEDTSHYIAIADIEKLLSFMTNKDGDRKSTNCRQLLLRQQLPNLC